VVEDDPSVGAVLLTALRSRGWDAELVTGGGAAMEAATVTPPDVVVLDLGLPDMDGLDVCAALRRWFPNPIIVLSADGAEDRKVRALDLGADDYVTKPFSVDELAARIRVALRHRSLLAATVEVAELRLGDLTIDAASRRVRVGPDEVELTAKEFDLLLLLARNAGRVLTHAAITAAVWPTRRPTSSGPLRIQVTNLRKKLGDGPERPRIATEPGVGYRLLVAGREGP